MRQGVGGVKEGVYGMRVGVWDVREGAVGLREGRCVGAKEGVDDVRAGCQSRCGGCGWKWTLA